ncbi:Nucleoporin nup57, partial [Spiromyces aspiralis]
MSLNFGGTTSSLFGNSKPAFGLSVTTSTPTQTNQKGSSAPNTATPGQGAGTGLFGSTTTPSEPNKRPMFGSSTTSGSGLFGTPSTTGGLFGNNAATSAAGSTGSGLFGTTATSTAGNASSGGLFGNTSGNALGGFTTGFGSTAPKTDSTTGGFGLFGSSSSAVPTTSTGLTAAGTLGGSGTTQTSSQQDQETRQEFDQICQQLMFIKECWDPASPNCQFRHYFYNVVDPSQVQLYQCPPNQDPVLWQLAQRDNPDPSRLVPALASSFKDLKERSDEQKRQLTAYQATAD